MGGGIMQLVAYGAQDIYLTGNPQITFFKVVYRRHTNFSMETIKQNISGQSFIGVDTINNKATVTISRNGDLLTGVYVLAKQMDENKKVCIRGDSIIEEVEIEIGGQRVDKHYREWHQIWDELTTPISKSEGYKYMCGAFNNNLVVGGDTKQEMVRYPLKFWFCRNPGLALPLISLQYHEIQLKFTWGIGKYNTTGVNTSGVQDTNNLTRTNDKTASGGLSEQHSVEVWADYVYLDTDERRRFSQVSHEYLIEQLQVQKEKGISSESFKLNLEHPIKELIWTTPQTPGDAITDQKIKLSINGHDRFYERDKEYFTLEQPYKHHTSIPGYNIKETESPVYLNETIYSNEYKYKDDITDTLAPLIDSDTDYFTNHTIDNKTDITSGSSLSPESKTFLFKSGGTDTLNTMEFKVGDIVVVNYYRMYDDLRHRSAEEGGCVGNTVSETRNYKNGSTPLNLRLEMHPIVPEDTNSGGDMTESKLTDGTWRSNIINTIDYVKIKDAETSGASIFFITEKDGEIRKGDAVVIGPNATNSTTTTEYQVGGVTIDAAHSRRQVDIVQVNNNNDSVTLSADLIEGAWIKVVRGKYNVVEIYSGVAGEEFFYITPYPNDDDTTASSVTAGISADDIITITPDASSSTDTLTFKVASVGAKGADIADKRKINITNIDGSPATELPTLTAGAKIQVVSGSVTTDGIQHDTPGEADGTGMRDYEKWAYDNIVDPPKKPRHATKETTGNIHEELNSSYITNLEVKGGINYLDKSVENIIRNLTVLKVFKTTLDGGSTIFEVTFNDSINLDESRVPALKVNDKVSFEIIARVQNPKSRCSQLKKDIYVYSFCLEPEEHQPSGSCNFSRIDSAKLLINSKASISNIYAVNYNVLRVISGMGGVAYSS
tara:strand:- start:1061 stop:3730 length:2670 start_codon:yes stop_codon:yes gene_type:complete